MAGTAYADATLGDVLDMQVGVAYSELYSDPAADIWSYARAGGLRPLPPGHRGPGSFHEFLVTLRKEGEHGQAFAYKTVNTEVLCWVMQRIGGAPLAEVLSRRIWSQLGCEEDGYLSVDSTGTAMGGGGLAATLRDMARFGEMLRCEGSLQGRQVVPAAVVAEIRSGSDREKFAKAGYTLLGGYSYRDMWWVTHDEHHAFEARGIHGQRLYVAPVAEMVVARFASHPIAASAANDPITLPALAALGRMLRGR
jgi:CubicO group peptidase (beta-lactamase class C family)